jgi:hypothetical protein
MLASKFPAAGLLADDAMGLIGNFIQTLKRKHYKSANPVMPDEQ